MTLTGTIQSKLYAQGSKSECMKPYIFLENGSQILLYKENDNPFENNAFTEYEGKNVSVTGEFTDGVFTVNAIDENTQSQEEN